MNPVRPYSYFHESIAKWPNVDRTCDDGIEVSVDMYYTDFKKISVCRYISGRDIEERYGDDDLETYLIIDGDAAKKLANKFSALDGKTFVKRFAERFAPRGRLAFEEIKRFLDKKEIPYTFFVY